MAIVPISRGKRYRKNAAARRDALVTEHLALVEGIARGVATRLPPSFDVDDLIATGNIALVQAADRYDPAAHAGTPFAVYARCVVRGAMLDSCRRSRYTENTRPSIDKIHVDHLAQSNVIEMEIDGDRLRQRVRAAVAQLPAVERSLILKMYGSGELTQPQINVRMKNSRAATREAHERALQALREQLAA